MSAGMSGVWQGWRLSALVALLVLGGLWGCSRGPSASQAERIRLMEARIEQLVGDFQVVAQARDQARERITALEEQVATLSAVTKERDQLRAEVAKVSRERDIASNRAEKLRKGFMSLLTEDDTLAAEQAGNHLTKASKGKVPVVAASGSGETPQE